MSSTEEHVPVEAAASLFASDNETGTDLFDSYFNQPEPENNVQNSAELFPESSAGAAANLFEGGPDENTNLFPGESSLDVFPTVDLAGSVESTSTPIFQPEVSSVSYERETLSQTGYYNPESQTGSTDYGNHAHTYENTSYQPNDVYSTSYYQPSQTNEWTTYATSNNTGYGVTYAPQVPSSSQYSHPPQMHYNAPVSASQDYTPSTTDTATVSSPQYFTASGGPTSLNDYRNIEPRNPINTVPGVTAYRPTTRNAYDPPIPTKSRVKPRYAPPNNSLNYTSPQSSQTFASSEPRPYGRPFSQSSSVPSASEASQDTHSFTSEPNSIYPGFRHDNGVQQISQLDYVQGAVSASNTDTRTIAIKRDSFEGSTTYAPYSNSSEYLQSGAGTALASSGEENRDTTNLFDSITRAVDQELPPTLSGPDTEPNPFEPNPSGISPEYGFHEAGQQFTPPASIPDDKPKSNIFAPPAQSIYDPYAPTRQHEHNAQSFSQHSYDPYGPKPYDRALNATFGSLPSSSQISAGKEDQGYTDNIAMDSATVDRTSKVTFLPISTATTTHAPYAPSPTLVGANDPLGRASMRVPVISFGFGGKLVSCFHLAQDAGGFDVSLTARQTTSITVRSLTEVIPASAMESSGSSFPGPLFSDPGISSLARTVGVGLAGQVKSKKASVIKWLDERAKELGSGMAYIASGSSERHQAEGRLALLLLLKVMVENDGQLSGSSSLEWAVRTALVPRLRGEMVPANDDLSLDSSLYTPYLSMAESTEQPTSVHYVKDSSLDRIKEFLVRGEKVKAYHYAMDEKLWAHAMLIANSIDAQAYKEVVGEFIHSELGIKQVLGATSEQTFRVNGKESLRVAYSLFSGQGASSIQELIPSKALSSNNVTSAGAQFTPVTPSFQKPSVSFLSSLSPEVLGESLAQWQETAAMMVFTQATGDSAALTSLGDCLAANRWFEAAHACYLLSPRTSSFGGITVPSVRMILVGSESPAKLPNFHKDLDVTLLSEIVEFALSLSTLKGQDQFSGLPHLQAYKLLRAYHLAEMGYIEAANRYCEAIGSSIRASSRGSQFYTPTFIGSLKNLSDRLTTIPQSDKSGSWVSRTMTKPSFDTIGGWLESRFSKIIVGEGEDNVPSPSKEVHPKATYGPFSHYSSITSAAPSAPPSRSATPHTVTNAVLTASSMTPQNNPIDRAASAFDYARLDRPRTSPIQRVASASAIAPPGKSQGENSLSRYRASSNTAAVPEDTVTDTPGQGNTWWGSSTDSTPTAAAFYNVASEGTQSNFISLMDGAPSGLKPNSSNQQAAFGEEEEDLGFGNSSFKKTKVQQNATENEAREHPQRETVEEQPKKPATAVKPELVQQSSSWLGSLWSWRRGSTQSPAPVVANLGEEKSFYYDKELKRWVNKNAPDNSTVTPPPPPPPRAQTASPSVALPNGTHPVSNAAPSPPPRSSSAVEPPRKPPRVRSNLVPKEELSVPSSAPPIPNSFDPPGLNGMPPTSRPKSSASKRNVRSRYVDVFQSNT